MQRNAEVGVEALRQARFFWDSQRVAVQDLISSQTLIFFDLWTKAKNIGYGAGQIRPNRKEGQWDLYLLLKGNCPEIEAMVAAGLTALEVSNGKSVVIHRNERTEENRIETDGSYLCL